MCVTMRGSENVKYTYIRLSEPYYHQLQVRGGPSGNDLKFEAVSSPEKLDASRETSLSHSVSSCLNCMLPNSELTSVLSVVRHVYWPTDKQPQ
jgi:hypothetical protein